MDLNFGSGMTEVAGEIDFEDVIDDFYYFYFYGVKMVLILYCSRIIIYTDDTASAPGRLL